jgi:hypothetical protein
VVVAVVAPIQAAVVVALIRAAVVVDLIQVVVEVDLIQVAVVVIVAVSIQVVVVVDSIQAVVVTVVVSNQVVVTVAVSIPVVVDSIQVVVIVISILRRRGMVEIHPCLSHFEIREIKMVMAKTIMVIQNKVLVVGEVIQALEQLMAMIQKIPVDAQHSIVQQRVVASIIVEDFEVKIFYLIQKYKLCSTGGRGGGGGGFNSGDRGKIN